VGDHAEPRASAFQAGGAAAETDRGLEKCFRPQQGPIWQRNYRDTLIRDGDHFANAVRYIRKNPVKAKLPEDAFTLWQSERAAKIS
jgi:hypothetical protein